MRQTLLDYFLSELLMFGDSRFHKSDSLSEHRDIALENAFDIIGGREFRTSGLGPAIGIDTRLRGDSGVYLEAFIIGMIFRVIHDIG